MPDIKYFRPRRIRPGWTSFMSFSVGIVGLPNVGKSTLFKALTKKKVDIADYPFTTIEPNIGIVAVPDKRLEKISSLFKPEKTVETIIEFVDIAGLVKNAHKGEGLGNQFLNHIRNCDAVLEVISNFRDSANIEEDIKTIETEFLMKDLETLEKTPEKSELFKKLKEQLSQGNPVREINLNSEEKSEIKECRFLTEKPIIYLINKNEQKAMDNEQKLKKSFAVRRSLFIDLKLEEEASELSETEKKELNINSKLDQLILACYNILDLITFFTIKGGKEAKAWTLKNGFTTYDAAEIVHSDFQDKFIRAEIIAWQELINAGSWLKAKELGRIKTVGKEYIVKDGDIIEFKI